VQSVEELTRKPAADLVALMADRRVSPVEVVDACLAAIDRHDPLINAFTVVDAERARGAARESERRIQRNQARVLEGLPIPIKDEIDVAGLPTSMGSRMAPSTPAAQDAELVRRLRDAGAIVIGKTNMPEFGSVPSTEGALWGACHNPWDLSRTAGGSSGGSAAAIAAGMAPAAHGRDGGGSLRIPASCCGLVSIKTSRGRISQGPAYGDVPHGLTVDGFITRTVADQALLLDVVSGPAVGDYLWASPPERPFGEEIGASAQPLRIGWTTHSVMGTSPDPACERALRDALALCERLGHQVEEMTTEVDDDSLLATIMSAWSTHVGWDVELLREVGGDPGVLEPHNQALYAMAQAMNAAQGEALRTRMQRIGRLIAGLVAPYDVVMTPTLGELPLPLGALFEHAGDDPLYPLGRAGIFMPYTMQFNITGQPAMTLPLHWEGSLPVGVQFVGPPAGEAVLLRLGAQIEQAAPWAHRRPAALQ
jgi:amidase